jgi:hypothetical protein
MATVHRTSSRVGSAAAAVLAAASLAGALGCATQVPFQPSSQIPSASGNLAAKLDDNGNSWVEVEFEHLAVPASLSPPKATYVVWAESQFGRQVLLGQIAVDDSRRAEWRGTVPFDRFRILLSAEDLAWPERPREPILLKTDYVKTRR